jgi:hypothetical protein
MSGKRQHFIPRFLLKGFASHKINDEIYTWVYRKDSNPFNTNIINIGAEGYFYSNGNDTQADDIITKAEETFSFLVKKLRDGPLGYVNNPQIPNMIAHFEIRTRHLRESFLRTGNYFVSRLIDFMNDEKDFIEYLERTFRNDPSLLRKALEKELKKQGIPQGTLEPSLKLTYRHLPTIMKQLKPYLRQFADYCRVNLPETLSKAAKSGHIRALKENISPEVKANQYKDLIYRVLEVPQGGLILGDSIIIFKVEGSKLFKTFLEKKDVLNAVILPLNSRKILVGTQRRFNISEKLLPEAIARCSLEYFVAEEDSDTNLYLQKQIGEDAYPLTKEQMEDIITESIHS